MKILKFGPQNHEANCGPNFSVPLKLTVLYSSGLMSVSPQGMRSSSRDDWSPATSYSSLPYDIRGPATQVTETAQETVALGRAGASAPAGNGEHRKGTTVSVGGGSLLRRESREDGLEPTIPPPPPPQQQQQQQRRQRRQYTREGDGVLVHDDNNNIYGTTGACFSLPLPFPAISPAQVLAPKILQVHKVATYVRAKLAAEGVEVEMVEPKQHQEEEEEGEEEDVLVVERTTSTSTRSTGKCVCVCVCLYACWGRGLRFLVWTSAWGG